MQPSLFDFKPPALSVSVLTSHIRNLFDLDTTLQDVWVEGEISNWSPAHSGHIYFTLKDAGASIRCVIWRSTARRLSYRPVGNGEAVLAHGRVSVYEVGGTYQLYVNDLEPVGQGALYAQFERLKRQLSDEGLFDEDRKQPLPAFPRRIGIVTSARAAALRDILNVLARRFPLIEVILSPAPVQGSDAPPKIVKALKTLTALTPPPDVIILARGGGSIEDLWAFNDETVARSVADSPIPIISGVGHETDFTIADFAADRRAPTPSAAAEVAVPDADELRRMVAGYRYQFVTVAGATVAEKRASLQDALWRLQRLSPQTQVDTRRQQIDDTAAHIRRALRHTLDLRQEQLGSALARLEALNPKATLSRGYAIVQKGDALITRVGDVSARDTVTVIVSDGAFEAEVVE
ncbi:MAG TPA: exodeoxyribonuclease VII large subunit [Chloroflexi bacterium]|nr:exodeoxyribonuclease VII large subunit [Chloroflexota bacterium]